MYQDPVMAHNSPDLIAFCEAVKNHLEQVDCADHISKVQSPVLFELINERCYKNDTDYLILVQNINISDHLLFTRKDKYDFTILKKCVRKKFPLLKRVRDMQYTYQAVIKIWGIINEYVETTKIIYSQRI